MAAPISISILLVTHCNINARKSLSTLWVGGFQSLLHFLYLKNENTEKNEHCINMLVQSWSGRRDSDSRHPPWQGGTLPLSYYRIAHQHMILYIIIRSLSIPFDKKRETFVSLRVYISLRPSIALARVTSSVYSRSPPTGRPCAIRVTRMPMGLSRRAI